MIVVDASVVTGSLCDDGITGRALRRRLASHDALAVPEVMDLEVLSALRGLVKAGRLDAADALRALADLRLLPLERVAHRNLTDRIWELRDDVTPYDAAYVALAERLMCPLLTADRRLARASGPLCEIELVR